MKVKICNLGVVEEAEINLKPLTAFIGENGTGKTWTAYTIGSIFSSYGYSKYLKAFSENQTNQTYPLIKEAVRKIIEEGNAQLDLLDFSSQYLELYVNDIAEISNSYLLEFMGSQRINFKNIKTIFDVSDSKSRILNEIKSASGESKIAINPQNREGLLNSIKEENSEKIYFYTGAEIKILEKLPEKVVEQFLFRIIFEFIHRSFYRFVYFFPTERTTFIALPFSVKEKKTRIQELEVKSSLQTAADKDSFLIPIQELISIMAYASYTNLENRKKEAESDISINKYMSLADILEEDILKGKVTLEKSEIKTELLFKTASSPNIELSLSSSLVKELTTLVLYLRYIARSNDLIIIDEPEMNLHPAAQVEIIEFLAMLVQAGLNVLITTHSPYIVDHLSNLMRAAKYEDKERIKERFYLERTEAFIPQEQVSVYLFEDGTAKNILSEDGKIDWGTFADVSDDISRILP